MNFYDFEKAFGEAISYQQNEIKISNDAIEKLDECIQLLNNESNNGLEIMSIHCSWLLCLSSSF